MHKRLYEGPKKSLRLPRNHPPFNLPGPDVYPSHMPFYQWRSSNYESTTPAGSMGRAAAYVMFLHSHFVLLSLLQKQTLRYRISIDRRKSALLTPYRRRSSSCGKYWATRNHISSGIVEGRSCRDMELKSESYTTSLKSANEQKNAVSVYHRDTATWDWDDFVLVRRLLTIFGRKNREINMLQA